jgi:hypothetical protein
MVILKAYLVGQVPFVTDVESHASLGSTLNQFLSLDTIPAVPPSRKLPFNSFPLLNTAEEFKLYK